LVSKRKYFFFFSKPILLPSGTTFGSLEFKKQLKEDKSGFLKECFFFPYAIDAQ
jgi:hypothetical protein